MMRVVVVLVVLILGRASQVEGGVIPIEAASGDHDHDDDNRPTSQSSDRFNKTTTNTKDYDPDEDDPLMEPWTTAVSQVVSKEDCDRIIVAAELAGFSKDDIDSIDADDRQVRKTSWSMDIMYRDIIITAGNAHVDTVVQEPAIMILLEPYLSRLDELVVKQRQKRQQQQQERAELLSKPSLDWVFLRKYSASHPRRDLKIHHDVNAISVNIALNDEYEGGGYFYVKPRRSYFEEEDECDGDSDHGNSDHDDEPSSPWNSSRIPGLPNYMQTYEFLSEVIAMRNASTTSISSEQQSRYFNMFVFPQLSTGDVFLHNYTVWHGIAPLQKGSRYSLLLFYDMSHPDVVELVEETVHVCIRNLYAPHLPIRLYHVNTHRMEITRELVKEEQKQQQHTSGRSSVNGECYWKFHANSEEEFEVVNEETGRILYSFDVDKTIDYMDTPILIGPRSWIEMEQSKSNGDARKNFGGLSNDRHDSEL